jgi:hypothetical protein
MRLFGLPFKDRYSIDLHSLIILFDLYWLILELHKVFVNRLLILTGYWKVPENSFHCNSCKCKKRDSAGGPLDCLRLREGCLKMKHSLAAVVTFIWTYGLQVALHRLENFCSFALRILNETCRLYRHYARCGRVRKLHWQNVAMTTYLIVHPPNCNHGTHLRAWSRSDSSVWGGRLPSILASAPFVFLCL